MHTNIYIFRESTGCFALKNIFSGKILLTTCICCVIMFRDTIVFLCVRRKNDRIKGVK